MNGWQRNGRYPQWSTEQMMECLRKVHAKAGVCGIAEYRELREDGDPTHQGIIARFGTWNRAKIRAGLPITVRAGNVRTVEAEADEVEAPPPAPTSLYPCWRCHRDYQGRGHKQSDYFCYACREQVNDMARNMAWLG